MDELQHRQVEWIDELVFPEGFQAALKLHLYGAPSRAVAGHAVQLPTGLEPKDDAVWRNVVQSGAAGRTPGGGDFSVS
jgi:hypothetical protein